MTYDPKQYCNNCGFFSPHAPVCHGCQTNERGFDAGVAAERSRCVRVCEEEARRLEATGNEIPRYGAIVAEQLAERIRSGAQP